MADGPPMRARSAGWPALAGAALLALVVRLAYLAELQGSPLLSGLMGDSRQYDAWAQQIAGGEWVGTQVFYQAPLYPYFARRHLQARRPRPRLVRVIQAVLGAASCVLLGLAGRRFFSDRVGVDRGAAAGRLSSGVLLRRPDPEIVARHLPDHADARPARRVPGARARWTWLAALGVAIAAFVLNRENARVLFPVDRRLAVARLPGRPIAPPRRRGSAVFAAASLAVLLPVGFRNYRVGGEFLVSTSQLGPNFYIGNNPHASGTYEPLVPERGDPLFERDDATRLASDSRRPRALAWRGVGLLARPVVRLHPEPAVSLAGADGEEGAPHAQRRRTARHRVHRGVRRLLPDPARAPLAELRRDPAAGRVRSLGFRAGMATAAHPVRDVRGAGARGRHLLRRRALPASARARSSCCSRRRGLGGLLDMRPGGTRPAVAAREARGRAEARRPADSLSRRLEATMAARAGRRRARGHRQPTSRSSTCTTRRTSTSARCWRRTADRPTPSLCCRRPCRSIPSHAEPHFRLGLAYRDAGEPQAAIEELTAAVRLRPDRRRRRTRAGRPACAARTEPPRRCRISARRRD